MTTNEQIDRIDSDIDRIKKKIKLLQDKVAKLSDRKKRLQDRALLETISGIAPDYDQAQRLLCKLKAEQETGQHVDGGAEHGSSSSERPRDG